MEDSDILDIIISSKNIWLVNCQNFVELYASMFVWRVVFWPMSVCLERNTGRSFWPIVSKLGPHVKSCTRQNPIVFYVKGQITRSRGQKVDQILKLP